MISYQQSGKSERANNGTRHSKRSRSCNQSTYEARSITVDFIIIFILKLRTITLKAAKPLPIATAANASPANRTFMQNLFKKKKEKAPLSLTRHQPKSAARISLKWLREVPKHTVYEIRPLEFPTFAAVETLARSILSHPQQASSNKVVGQSETGVKQPKTFVLKIVFFSS